MEEGPSCTQDLDVMVSRAAQMLGGATDVTWLEETLMVTEGVPELHTHTQT